MAINDPKKPADETKERLQVSRKSENENYWAEILEVFQTYKCRVDPLKKEDGTEDKTRTNLCMPDVWVMTRRKAARLAARPPVLKVRAKTPAVGEYLSHLSQYQWDRGREQAIQKRHVLQAELFGWSFKAHWWDKITESRRFRRSTKKILQEYGIAMDEESGAMGVPKPEEIYPGGNLPWQQPPEGEQAQKSRRIVPYEQFNEDQIAGILSQLGLEVPWHQDVRKYEGPVSSFVFIGDIHLEPGAESIHKSAWVIHEQIWDLETLAYWLEQEFEDPRTGEKRAAISQEAARELYDSQSWAKDRDKSEDLKNELRAKLFKTSTEVDTRLIPGKRFHVMAEHTFRDGWPYVRWIGNEKVVLQEGMPLPWDLGGRYPFSAFTPIPDLLYYTGDSSPRILRHLVKAHNITVDQRMDLVSNAMKPLVLMRKGADLPGEVIDRGAYRVLLVETLADVRHEGLGQSHVPPEAWEQEKQLILQMASAEPALNTYGTESQAQPGSSMVATVANYQARAGETLSQDELENLNLSLAEETTIKLLMWQQSIDEELQGEVDEYIRSLGAGGGLEAPKTVRVDSVELSEDFEVEPEMSSTLALDDEMRRNDAVQLYQLATADPVNFNVREAAIQLAQTYKGRDVTKLINPLPETPPRPEIKPSLNVQFKDLPGYAQHQLLEKFGVVVPETEKVLDRALGGVEKMSKTADALASLEQPVAADVPPEEEE